MIVYRNPEYYPDPTAGAGIWRALRPKAERLQGAAAKILKRSKQQKAATQAKCIIEAVERLAALELWLDLDGLRYEAERIFEATNDKK